jgi:hypothetical protein
MNLIDKQQIKLNRTMKKLALTIAIVLGLSMTTFAEGGGLFQRGAQKETTGLNSNRERSPFLPGHGENTDQDGDQTTPVGTGVVLLAGLGAAYLIGKRRKED